ncbi:MAG: hypothetical protein ACI9E5_001270, partial [Candidatus Omnitrophota bacterium]
MDDKHKQFGSSDERGEKEEIRPIDGIVQSDQGDASVADQDGFVQSHAEDALNGPQGLGNGVSMPSKGSAMFRKEAPFVSRFGSWMRVCAFVVVMIFLPEQISWAFNYDPSVIWNDKFEMQQNGGLRESTDEKISAYVAQSVVGLMNQMAYEQRGIQRIKVSGNNVKGLKGEPKDLEVFKELIFSKQRVRQYKEWLNDPSIHPLNCGVFAAHDLLAAENIQVPLEEISINTLTVDILSNIIRPGDPRLKTSLFAINKVTEVYGINLHAIKIAPHDVDQLNTPFIASFKDEHFVAVSDVRDGYVYYTDVGQSKVLSTDKFASEITGYVLAKDIKSNPQLQHESVSQSAQAFVWGSKWQDNSDNLPGLYDTGDMLLQVAITLGSSFAFATGQMQLGVAMMFALFSYTVSQFSSTIATVCVMKGACTQDQAMILNIALSAALTVGMVSFAPPSALAGGATGGAAGSIVGNAGGAGAAAGTSSIAGALQSLGEGVRAMATAVNGFMDTLMSPLTSVLDQVTGALGLLAGTSVPTAVGTAAANQVADHVMMKFMKGFVGGFVVGGAKGYVQMVVADAVNDLIGGDDNSVLVESVIGMVSSLTANVAVTAGVVILESHGADFGLSMALDPFSNDKDHAVGDITVDVDGIDGTVLTKTINPVTQAVRTVLRQSNLNGQVLSLAVRFIADEVGGVDADSLMSQAIGNLAGVVYGIGGKIQEDEAKAKAAELNPLQIAKDEATLNEKYGKMFFDGLKMIVIAAGVDAIEEMIVDGDRSGQNTSSRLNLVAIRGFLLLSGTIMDAAINVATDDETRKLDINVVKDDNGEGGGSSGGVILSDKPASESKMGKFGDLVIDSLFGKGKHIANTMNSEFMDAFDPVFLKEANGSYARDGKGEKIVIGYTYKGFGVEDGGGILGAKKGLSGAERLGSGAVGLFGFVDGMVESTGFTEQRRRQRNQMREANPGMSDDQFFLLTFNQMDPNQNLINYGTGLSGILGNMLISTDNNLNSLSAATDSAATALLGIEGALSLGFNARYLARTTFGAYPGKDPDNVATALFQVNQTSLNHGAGNDATGNLIGFKGRGENFFVQTKGTSYSRGNAYFNGKNLTDEDKNRLGFDRLEMAFAGKNGPIHIGLDRDPSVKELYEDENGKRSINLDGTTDLNLGFDQDLLDSLLKENNVHIDLGTFLAGDEDEYSIGISASRQQGDKKAEGAGWQASRTPFDEGDLGKFNRTIIGVTLNTNKETGEVTQSIGFTLAPGS